MDISRSLTEPLSSSSSSSCFQVVERSSPNWLAVSSSRILKEEDQKPRERRYLPLIRLQLGTTLVVAENFGSVRQMREANWFFPIFNWSPLLFCRYRAITSKQVLTETDTDSHSGEERSNNCSSNLIAFTWMSSSTSSGNGNEINFERLAKLWIWDWTSDSFSVASSTFSYAW